MTRTAATKRKQNARPEAKLLNQIRLAIGSRRDVMILRISTGVYRSGKHTIRSAPSGTADILGVHRRTILAKETINPLGFSPHEREYLMTYGQAIAIEVKSPTGTQSKEQVAFEKSWVAMGGTYIVARSVNDVLAVLGPERD